MNVEKKKHFQGIVEKIITKDSQIRRTASRVGDRQTKNLSRLAAAALLSLSRKTSNDERSGHHMQRPQSPSKWHRDNFHGETLGFLRRSSADNRIHGGNPYPSLGGCSCETEHKRKKERKKSLCIVPDPV